MTTWWQRLRARLEDLDRQVARDTLASFEREVGVRSGPARVRLGSVDDVGRLVRPESRPLVVHHWATWCEPCLEELPRLDALLRQVTGRADVVGVCWDRFDAGGETAPETLARVAAFAEEHAIRWPSIVVDAGPEQLFRALDLRDRTVPQTHVLDADGGVLRTVSGPLAPTDVEAIASMLTP